MECPYEDVCIELDDLLETETDRKTCSPDNCDRYDAIFEGEHLCW